MRLFVLALMSKPLLSKINFYFQKWKLAQIEKRLTDKDTSSFFSKMHNSLSVRWNLFFFFLTRTPGWTRTPMATDLPSELLASHQWLATWHSECGGLLNWTTNTQILLTSWTKNYLCSSRQQILKGGKHHYTTCLAPKSWQKLTIKLNIHTFPSRVNK